MKLEYTALSKANKKITGILDAENIEAAHEELHKMGLAIIAVNEISDEEYEEFKKKQDSAKAAKGIKTFSFMAMDGNGKEVEGTIDALDDFSAYKRLRTEYKLKVDNLYPETATEDEKVIAKSKLETFEKNLKQNSGQSGEDDNDNNELNARNEEIDKSFIAEIDNIIIHTKKILETSKDLFSNVLIQNIQNTLGELEKIRSSNNINHIKELSDQLYELISNPDITEGNSNENKEYQSIISELESNTAENEEDGIHKKAVGLSGIRSIFKKITKRFKELGQPKQTLGEPKDSIINKIKTQISAFFSKFKKKDSALTQSSEGVKKPKYNIKTLFNKIKSIFKKKTDIPTDTAEAKNDDAVGDAHVRPSDKNIDKKPTTQPEPTAQEDTKKIGYFTYILTEIDSFISWLLCFYIIYFFLVNFALEKNIGLNSEFVIKTFKTPLILNITILLLLFHLSLRIKNIYLRNNLPASLFLLFLTIGTYTILIVNF